MSDIQWTEVLGWGDDELDDLRYVAYSYIQQGIYDIALTFFNALAVLSPPTAWDLQTLGALHLQLGNGTKALEILDQALSLDPTHLPTQLNRAKALVSLGLKQQGIIQAMKVERQASIDLAKQASALVLAERP